MPFNLARHITLGSAPGLHWLLHARTAATHTQQHTRVTTTPLRPRAPAPLIKPFCPTGPASRTGMGVIWFCHDTATKDQNCECR